MNSNLPYRPNVCLFILNKNNEIFIGERLGAKGVWQLPQGGIEEDLDEKGNALREAHEELGVDMDLLSIQKKLDSTYRYDFDVVPKYFEGKFKGQQQCFYVLKYTGTEGQINLSRFEQEFSDWKWVSLEDFAILSLIHI